MKILVLGATGMLGSSIFRNLSEDEQLDVFGTVRNPSVKSYFTETQANKLISNVDVLDNDTLTRILEQHRPNVVINCIGLIKQLSVANDPLHALPINSLLPHRLARLCSLADIRLIHFSTDCVFAGDGEGMYLEQSRSDAEDLYGKSKFIGELVDFPHALTLRTSIIGHELSSRHSLIDWFLSQQGNIKGFEKAIFSGLPAVEIAKVLHDFVLPCTQLCGLYHLSADPIDKYSLLKLVSEIYQKKVKIIPDDTIRVDRSLDSSRFRNATGYMPPSWRNLIHVMYEEYMRYKNIES